MPDLRITTDMSHHDHLPDASTMCRDGAAWLDSGLAPGLVVVDSNRPAIGAGSARGLRKQFGAAH